MMRASAFAGVLSLAALGLFGCSERSQCTPGASVACTCVSGATGAQVCASDGTYGACQCAAGDAGTPGDSGMAVDGSTDADGGLGRDAGSPSCGEAEALSFAPGILANMGGSIATVADIEGDERLEIIAFTSRNPTEVRVGTWSGTALDGPSRQLVDLTGFRTEQVAVDESGVPAFIGITEGSFERRAHRFGAVGYEAIEVRVLPEPATGSWYNVPNGGTDIYGRSYARLFASRAAWAADSYHSEAALYRFVFGADRVSAEQVDRDALFGSDMQYLAQIDGDVNEDGVEDFLLATSSDYWITESGPDDTWTRIASLSQATCEFPSSTYRFAPVGDLDGDGDRDLVLSLNCTAQLYGYAVALRTDTGYQLVHHSLPDAPSDLVPVALGDLDGDCDLDLVLSNGHVALNDGDGRFAAPVPLADESPGIVATIVDLDFDGDNDIVWGAGVDGPVVQLNQLR